MTMRLGACPIALPTAVDFDLLADFEAKAIVGYAGRFSGDAANVYRAKKVSGTVNILPFP